MKTEIKVCGMTCPAQMQSIQSADYIGLIFYELSPRNAFNTNQKEVRHLKIPKVGVFVDKSFSDIIRLANDFGVSVIQLHGNEPVELCRDIRQAGFKVWKAISVSQSDDLSNISRFSGSVDRILLDTPGTNFGGTGKKFNWDLLTNYTYDIPFMLAGGIGPNDVCFLESIRHPFLAGFDINSRFEVSPGIKDISLVNRFIEQIKLNQ